MQLKTYQHFQRSILLLAIFVVGLGAYTRLSNSGLGCPDWPACFGKWAIQSHHVTPPLSSDQTLKAWTEMIHRYIAGILGGLILLTTILQSYRATKLPILAIGICLLTTVQALFGMWTVTWKLHPLAVMPHLVGGMSITCLLFINYQQKKDLHKQAISSTMYHTIYACIICVGVQILLGGWTSANYAQLVCPDFPTCQGMWIPNMQIYEAFKPQPIGINFEGGILSGQARIAIHVSHRLGALISCFCFAFLLLKIHQQHAQLQNHYRRNILTTYLLFILQISLGIGNIVWQIPIHIAVAHNICALLLLLSLIRLLTLSHVAKKNSLSPHADHEYPYPLQ
ncbi:MAG: COX15/CtaA family protein [Pseudomonadota bacterium]|nr:COX15/CtaA family protein [Pseudomonadota bacterium]